LYDITKLTLTDEKIPTTAARYRLIGRRSDFLNAIVVQAARGEGLAFYLRYLANTTIRRLAENK
ncbi:hypothetical protein, partial [Pseudomonas syringae]|uniref:hypothetical protein n=1 Tax=Pseudomonas syringae TaxID=317 RepID=UPI001F2E0F72